MKVWTVIIGISVLLEMDGGNANKIKYGEVECEYTEVGKSGRGPRGLRLFSCKKDQINMQLDCTYYGGNPHNCGSYKPKLQDSIEKYYKQLAVSALNNGKPCSRHNITEDICGIDYPCVDGSCKHQEL